MKRSSTEHGRSRATAVPSAREPIFERALRFARACVVGSGASLVDFSILTAFIRLLDVAPTTARIPALLAGASVQFFGNRTFTFRAQRGSLSRQAKLFACFEVAALLLNWCVYRLLQPHVTFVPPEAVSFLGTFLVFVGFAYPMRKLVIFKLPAEPSR
ncbi:MAG: GtrA family protein [Deltaproteobacteria bacterium]|nr:GtrA family protein [Deltaproteobacteria bacterium]